MKVRVSMNSEAIKAGVLRVAPVGQNSHLNNLEGLVIVPLIDEKTTQKTKHQSLSHKEMKQTLINGIRFHNIIL